MEIALPCSKKYKVFQSVFYRRGFIWLLPVLSGDRFPRVGDTALPDAKFECLLRIARLRRTEIGERTHSRGSAEPRTNIFFLLR